MRHHLGIASAILCSLGYVQSALADCTLPPAPSKIPEASSATESEMLSAMQTLKHYNSDVMNYCKCLEFEASQRRLAANEQQRLQNSAVDGLKVIADKFNEQVRAFKAKGG